MNLRNLNPEAEIKKIKKESYIRFIFLAVVYIIASYHQPFSHRLFMIVTFYIIHYLWNQVAALQLVVLAAIGEAQTIFEEMRN